MNRWMRIAMAGLLAVCWVGTSVAATLKIGIDGTVREYASAALLADPRARDVQVPADVAYKRPMGFRAIPARALLEGVPAGATLRFTATDGFAAEMPAALLLSGEAEALLAVEPVGSPWPPLARGKPSAGPFYLVWLKPEAGHIGPEQWPYQIARIDVLSGLAERFPALLPAAGASAQVQAGFATFQKNCMACHRLNGAGDAQMGPDLNIPLSPLEYLGEAHLRTLVRNPQNLRRWPQARMPGFAPEVLPDAELDALLAYLRHMSQRKVIAMPVAADHP